MAEFSKLMTFCGKLEQLWKNLCGKYGNSADFHNKITKFVEVSQRLPCRCNDPVKIDRSPLMASAFISIDIQSVLWFNYN
jgi:hypothetical protein